MIKKLWNNFFSPTPSRIRKWQMFLMFIGGLSTVLEMTDKTIPSWVNITIMVCGYTGTFLTQFITRKEEAC